MKIRLTRPSYNKYYQTKSVGGLSNCIVGKPTITGANVLCNCVGYANSRFNEIINDPDLKGIVLNFKYQLTTNAENFIESAKNQGLKISNKPIQGGIMVWKKGATLGGKDGAGHVAVVEEVYDDGTILTSESGYNAYAFRTAIRDNTNGRWSQPSGYTFRGCIVNPGVTDPKVVPAPKLTVDGIGGPATVRAMQRFFSTPIDGIISGQLQTMSKYYPALKSVEYGKNGSPCIKNLQRWVEVNQDGVLGPATVKAWQKKLGVTVDGIFGPNSMKAFQKYLNEHDKAVYPEPTPTTWIDNANAWAKKIANEKYHYVVWNSKVEATKTCPICKGRKYDNYFGWNCIGFASAVWHHGGKLGNACNCSTISNPIGEEMYKAKTDAAALAIAKKRLGINDIQVIRNKSGIPKANWKAGDICLQFSGSTYKHMFYYMGDGNVCDSSRTKNTADNIKVRSYKNYSAKIIIRYIGK